jgi:putative oxidoreductase
VNEFDYATLLIRGSLGLTLAMHAYNHWRGGGRIAGTARWFESVGLRNGRMQAWASVLTEFAAAAGLLAGFLTPFACGATIGTMTVAVVTVHRRNGFFVFREGYEYVLMISLMSLALAVAGPGRFALDHAFDIVVRGALGAAIAVGAGLGGAALLLAATYRPAPSVTAGHSVSASVQS